ncbi:kelch repeat-containing protein [Nocardioides sp.]|uniref:kelch repeat-containing protein n=1 Tax=Nocardioides sp. TaxID=35761 RepID=UPI002ED105FF
MRSTSGRLQLVLMGALVLAGCSADEPGEREPAGAATGSPSTSTPVLGASHELLPDPGGDGVLLLSGPPELDPAGDPLQLWRWDGSAWSPVATTGDVPPQRSYFSATYDDARDVVVLYGGELPGDEPAVVWEWDGASWTAHDAAPGPGPRRSSAMTYDDDGLVLLYGGDDPGGIYNDTWAWDGEAWQRLVRGGPEPARWPGAFVDVADAGPVLVGGHQVEHEDLPAALGDTWVWDDEWQEAQDANAPPRLVNAKGLVHPEHGTLLVGGADLAAASGDVLRWTGTGWEMFAEDVFPERQAFGLAYDAGRDVVVLTGGVVEPGSTQRHQDVWEWSGDPGDRAVQVLDAPPA